MITQSDIVYLSGPMTGIKSFNFPKFRKVERQLKKKHGCKILNPANNFKGRVDLPRRVYMRQDIEQLLKASAIFMIEGWQSSKGARLEYAIAQELEIKICGSVNETICQESDRIVAGDRNSDYGHPFHDFTRTGRIWGAILGIPDVPPEKVGLCMVGLKISRECNRPKRDNRVDGAGYFKTVDLVHQWKEEHEEA